MWISTDVDYTIRVTIGSLVSYVRSVNPTGNSYVFGTGDIFFCILRVERRKEHILARPGADCDKQSAPVQET